MPLRRKLSTLSLALLLSACTSYGVIDNQPLLPDEGRPGYTLGDFTKNLDRHSNELTLAVAFSGGGTRAAALAYGVMQELRDTRVRINGVEQSLLDVISLISSVSGGSFTSAYYGLYGNRLFVDFEERFLRRNIEGALLRGFLDPLQWFSSHNRTEMAVGYYQQTLFGNATFADLMRKDAPLILINASDLGSGARFSFVQEYFNLLCSDLSSFPVARAVTASSAVPVVFDPVVVENYGGCARSVPAWLTAAQQRDRDSPNLAMIVQGDAAFEDKVNHKYAQFVDGGITDNLGLRAMLDTIELVGGAQEIPAKPGHPRATAHRHHLGERLGRHPDGHWRNPPVAVHREHAERRHQHPAAPLQRGHVAADAAESGALGGSAFHARAAGFPVLHPAELRGCGRRALAPLPQRDPHQLLAQPRAGGPVDRDRARIAAQQRGFPAAGGEPAGRCRAGQPEGCCALIAPPCPSERYHFHSK